MASFLDTVENLAIKLGDALSGGTIPAIVEIGKDVLDLIESAKDVVSSDDAVKLETIREELEPKVMAHADATENKLRGE